MTTGRQTKLEDVLRDEAFPAVDVALRRGCNIDRDDVEWYAFLVDGQEVLEGFYRRYGCELVHRAEGYFFLLPLTDLLRPRNLTVGEMCVGQTLALMYLDPTSVQTAHVVTRDALLTRLVGIIGEVALVRALNPQRRGKYDERMAQEAVRLEVGKALRALETLGFVEAVEGERLRLRFPLLRFADPVVRAGDDIGTALERLVRDGQVAPLESADPPVADDEDDA